MARIYLQRMYIQDLEVDSRHYVYLGFTFKASFAINLDFPPRISTTSRDITHFNPLQCEHRASETPKATCFLALHTTSSWVESC